MTEEIKKITKHDFYFRTSLYEKVKINTLSEDIFNGEVDAYSFVNKIETTYSVSNDINHEFSLELNTIVYSSFKHKLSGYVNIDLDCKRKDNDNIVFHILVRDDYIMKIGQFPSLADIQFAEIGKKYDKILNKEDLVNYKRAIGIFSHGFGIGSFVYLRRIFENLILKTFNDNKKELSISESDFRAKRMSEKVNFLKDYLPEEFSDFSPIYAILSKGVHELSEDECKKYFEVLKISIELILDDIIDMKKKENKKNKIKNKLKDITFKIK